MKYLTKDSLKVLAFERLIDESVADYQQSVDEIEKQRISEMKTMLSRQYDVDKIFSETTPVLHPFLSKILSKLVLYDVIRRNAYRKVPTDYKDEMLWAEKKLEDMNKGIIKFTDLPPKPIDETGGNSKILYGNLSNPDFYI
jgi:DNA-binding HxlR family transcriptional regulator